tara:strand:- start:1477 stop:1902 length:426 start_codon:yes stop_codon:yes gene_type:complete
MNYIDVELDAYEIAEKVFSENNELNRNFSFENVDIKTFFEMLLIITVEGLKKYYGDKNNKVDITILSKDDVDKINKYLEKINVKLQFKIYDILSYMIYKENGLLKNFTDMEIKDNTPLSSINYIIIKQEMNLVYAIHFDLI